MGILVDRLTSDDWRVLRDIRLVALADAPYAYGSTLARERIFTERQWRDRIERAGCLNAVAMVDAEPVGMIGAFPQDPSTVMLVAMWAHPAHRGRGIADALVTDLLAWARENGWSRVELRVADGNTAARKLFLRHGFAPTGVREPLESDPTVGTEYLARPV